MRRPPREGVTARAGAAALTFPLARMFFETVIIIQIILAVLASTAAGQESPASDDGTAGSGPERRSLWLGGEWPGIPARRSDKGDPLRAHPLLPTIVYLTAGMVPEPLESQRAMQSRRGTGAVRGRSRAPGDCRASPRSAKLSRCLRTRHARAALRPLSGEVHYDLPGLLVIARDPLDRWRARVPARDRFASRRRVLCRVVGAQKFSK
jgi:hypothetical protein